MSVDDFEFAHETLYSVKYYPAYKKWYIFKGNEPVSEHRKKTPALKKARKIAKDNKPSKLETYSKTGRLQKTHSYGI